MSVGDKDSQKEFTRNPISYGQVTKNLEVLLQDLISAPNEPLPHIAAQHVRGALQFIVDMNGAMDILENSNKQFQRSSANATEERLYGRNDVQYGQVVKNLEAMINNASDDPNEVVPNVTVHHVNGVLQVLRGLNAQLDLLERSNKELQRYSSGDSEASIITTASSNESFTGRVKKVADVLNIMAKTEMSTIHPEQLKALTDAYILLQGLAKGHMVVYLADPRDLVDSKGFTGMMLALENLLQENAHRDTPHVKLLQNVFNTLVLQLREMTRLEGSVEELRNMLIEREGDLRTATQELQAALQKEEAPQFERLPLLAEEQRGAENGWWVINRAWHDAVLQARPVGHPIDLETPEGRRAYRDMMGSAVAVLAVIANPGGVNSVATTMFVVEWDSFFTAEKEGDRRFGPVFCTGTLKLLPEKVSDEPRPPKEPHFLGKSEYPEDGLYAVDPAWVAWYGQLFPKRTNFSLSTDRNCFRSYLAETIKTWLQYKPESKTPIVIVDWDYSTDTGILYFTTPGINLIP